MVEKTICDNVDPLIMFVLMGVWGGGVGYIMNHDHDYTWRMLLIDMLVGGFVSTVVGFSLWGGHLPQLLIFASCGVSAVFSKEAMRYLRKKFLRNI